MAMVESERRRGSGESGPTVSFRPYEVADEIARRGAAPGVVAKTLIEEVLAVYAEARLRVAFRDERAAALFVEAAHDPAVGSFDAPFVVAEQTAVASVLRRVVLYRSLAADPAADALWDTVVGWGPTERLAMLDGARVYWAWAHGAFETRADALRAAGVLAEDDERL